MGPFDSLSRKGTNCYQQRRDRSKELEVIRTDTKRSQRNHATGKSTNQPLNEGWCVSHDGFSTSDIGQQNAIVAPRTTNAIVSSFTQASSSRQFHCKLRWKVNLRPETMNSCRDNRVILLGEQTKTNNNTENITHSACDPM